MSYLSLISENIEGSRQKESTYGFGAFEPGDLVQQVLNLGTTNPIDIIVVNRDRQKSKQTAHLLLHELSGVSY